MVSKRRTMETSETGSDQCIKDYLVNLQSRVSKYFSKALCDRYKWMTDPFHPDSAQNHDFFFGEENCIGIIADTSLKFSF
jgi:hypothetical protein